jgi:hypothetical protein
MGGGQAPGAIGLDSDAWIDDGTLARTESPDPGPIGLDAKSGSHGKGGSVSIADDIVAYAARRQGDRVGDGECFARADRALRAAGGRSAADYGEITPDGDYVWGSDVSLAGLRPGDIIQFRDYRYERTVVTEDSRGTTEETRTEERPHHTAIVERVEGDGAVTVWEQNSPAGSAVRRTPLYFSSGTTRSGRRTITVRVTGTFWFYRPQPR